MTRRPSFFESAAFGVLSFLLLAVIGLGGGVLIARAYGIELVGAYALAYAPVAVAGTLSTMQEGAAMVREIATLPPRAPRITGLFAAVMAFSFGLSVIASLLVMGGAALVFEGPLDRPELLLPAAVLLVEYALVSNTSWNLDMVFATFRSGRQLFWIRLLHAVVYLVLALVLAGVLDSVWGLVWAQVLSSVFSLALRTLAVRRVMRLLVPLRVLRDGMRTFPEILRFGRRMAHGFLFDGASLEAGTWLVGLTGSVALVGAWSRAFMLARRLFDVVWRVTEVLYPTLVERRKTDDHAGFDRALVDSARLVASGLLFPAAVAGGAADGVMDLFGPGFDAGAPALALLLLVPPLYAISAVMSSALIAVDRPLAASNISAARALMVVVLGFALSLWLDITGMALAMVIAFAVDAGWRIAIARGHLTSARRPLWPLRTVGGTLLAYAGGLGAARAADTLVAGVGGLALAVTLGAAAFLVIFVLAGGLTAEDRAHMARGRDRFRYRPQPATAPPSA